MDISLAMEEATEKNTFMRTDFLSDDLISVKVNMSSNPAGQKEKTKL